MGGQACFVTAEQLRRVCGWCGWRSRGNGASWCATPIAHRGSSPVTTASRVRMWCRASDWP